MNDEIIAFEKVTKKYGSDVVLDNVSFPIKRNSVTTLVGPNGAGKSTIAKLILGIEFLDSGKIMMPKKLSFAYLPQKIYINKYLPLRVSDFMKSYSAKKDYSDIELEILEFGQINQFQNKQLSELSGGQLQKICITSSILSRPDLLILDEPTKNLDFDHENKLYNLIGKIKEYLSIFIISHDLHMVSKSSDLVICLNHHICCSGLPTNFDSSNGEYAFYKHSHNHSHT
jgi:zinc transport system ATP-binding protein